MNGVLICSALFFSCEMLFLFVYRKKFLIFFLSLYLNVVHFVLGCCKSVRIFCFRGTDKLLIWLTLYLTLTLNLLLSSMRPMIFNSLSSVPFVGYVFSI